MWRPQTNQGPERITPPRQGKIVVNLSSEPCEKMQGRLTRSDLVVDEHTVARRALADDAIEQDDGNPGVLQRAHLGVGLRPGGIEDDPVHSLLDQDADDVAFPFDVAGRMAEEQAVAGGAQRALGPARQQRVERVGDVAHEQCQQTALSGHQRPGDRRGPIAEKIDRLTDTGARLGTHVGVIAHHP